MLWIAVDAMGGDAAPRVAVDGALAAARHFELGVALVGSKPALEHELARHGDIDSARVRIVDAPELIGMEESPAAALRRKPGASIKVAAELVARGDAAALFSAGHTGATVMAAYGAFGMVSGVDRPALAATIPTLEPARDPAGRGRERRVPAAASAAVRGDGDGVRESGARHRIAARRVAVNR